MKVTYKQLKKFYVQAYKDGYDGKLVCGGLGEITNNLPNTRVAIALIKAFEKDK